MVIPQQGKAFVSVRDADKQKALQLAQALSSQGFSLCATSGTAAFLREQGLDCLSVNKVKEGRPHCVDMIKNGEIQFIANTTEGKKSVSESHSIRASAIAHKVCYFTTLNGALAATQAMQQHDKLEVNRLQDLHQSLQK
jgi:carbamoyl-phosphate synthase large subunit